ncbi:hypothetical protein BXZ70DRAFT_119479 [Cristinia sonorae]|uniref:CCR4-NOT transcription complex subunit 11 n=1 Tax=Cristinia sonorae TaxID=1940300 RepID=A0A8K0XQC4_9AGAR|nr:hypothetical protein BXZ70DRAFT_119479 [Cristinia sonorae]
MQATTTTAYFSHPTMFTKQPTVDPLRASVGLLLSRAYSLPCSAAAQAFNQIVPPTSRFQLALDVMLPLLDPPAPLQQRILVSYMLYSLYAPHPIAINPFKSVLVAMFTREKDIATKTAEVGGISESEQLVWVLWKILRGDGSDIGPFTPTHLARSPVPPRLRASNLTLEEEPAATRPKFDPFGDSNSLESIKENGGSVATNGTSNGGSHYPGEPFEVTAERDRENAYASEGMALLLAARDRVLNLSEMRALNGLINPLTNPPMITSDDLAAIISKNPTLAHPVIAALVTANWDRDPDSVLQYLDILKHIPPTLPSFDVLGRLLRDPTRIRDSVTAEVTTIADLVRVEVLGWFIHESISWLENAEEEEKAGNISDDRFAKGVQHLCRFYNSLIKLGIVDPSSDADSTEMMHFSLRNSRFEEANGLYRTLAMGRF